MWVVGLALENGLGARGQAWSRASHKGVWMRCWDFKEVPATSILSVSREAKFISSETGEGRVSEVCRERRRESGRMETEAA